MPPTAFTTALKLLEKAREKTDHAAVAFSGGKDSTVVLDMCSRVFPKVSAFFFATVPGLKIVQGVLEWPVQKYGIPCEEHLDPRAADAMYGGLFCDSTALTDGLPRLTLNEGYEVAMVKAGAGAVAVGSKRSDGIWRSRQFTKATNLRSHFLYPLRDWTKMDVWGYLQYHGLTAHLSPDQKARAFGLDLRPESLCWMYDNAREDFERMELYFPYIRAAVKRRQFYPDWQGSISLTRKEKA